MGRQTQLHMLSQDLGALLAFVQEHDPVVVTLRDSDSSEVTPVLDPLVESKDMSLWNKTLLGSLERKLVSRQGGNDYYRVDYSLPTLELSPSRLTEWRDQPALLQGRVYGFFDRPIAGYDEWYQVVARWIRKSFTKSPLSILGGYIGPEALRWFQQGGTLLPMFEPPPTAEWMAFVEKQHVGAGSLTGK